MSGENLIGKTLGNRYEILELLGSGGMAMVYKARCSLLNRYVAVKVLRDSLKGDEAIVKNFKKEAQASASISHPNIVSVYDVGEEDGILYMVMEYVDGITLKEYIKKNAPLAWQEACGFAIQICQALTEAHKNGIVHRDIKPQNIMMTSDGILKVTDFGIAHAAASETSVAGGVVGSVHYISPEQARGGFTDAKSDIYSTGVVLYEMLTGQVPFNGETAVAVALQHLEKEPAPVKCVNMDIPSDLSYVTMKAMAKDQTSRYSSAQEMTEDLRAVLADEMLPSREGEPEEDEGEDLEATKKIETPEKITPQTDVQEIITTPITRRGEQEDVADKKNSKKSKKKQKTKQQKKEDKMAVILAIVTVVVLALIAGGVYFYLNSAKELVVPDFTNKTIEEAKSLASEEGFVISDSMEYSLSDVVEEGKIVSQTPEAGKTVKKNNEIKLVISLGSTGGNISVPSVINMTETEAVETLLEENLLYAVAQEPSDTVEAGRVARQLPAVGTKVKEEEVVTIYISTGPDGESTEAKQQIEVPNVVGETRARAEEMLTAKGFTVSVSRKYSTEIGNTVLSQSPNGGRMADEGSTISIVIANGEAPIETDSPERTSSPTERPTRTSSPTERPARTSSPTQRPSSDDENGSGDEPRATRVPVREESTSTKSYTVMIPSSADDTVNVRIEADGRTIHQGTHSKSEGGVTVNITGSGTKQIEAYIDGQKVDSTSIDFD